MLSENNVLAERAGDASEDQALSRGRKRTTVMIDLAMNYQNLIPGTNALAAATAVR